MADLVLHLALLTSDGEVGRELARLTLNSDDRVVASGERGDLAADILGGIMHRYRLTEDEAFRAVARDGWTNTKMTLYSVATDSDE